MDYMMPDSQSAFYDAVAANNQTVVDAINAIIQSGEIKVTYIPGNHDLLATDADIARIFPGINQARDSMQGLGSYVTGTNSEIVIEHGHRYDLYSAPDPISNREITQNGTSILTPAYFYARIAPMTNPAGQKTIYANSGTWIDHAPRNPSMTFVVISPQKADSAIEIVNLYQYAKDQTITQWANGQAITNP